ncbi:MAG: glutathione transferase GstA [Gammaproteobacteria bacterium]|nr:glutathione transferase GstA [Gammaproteobacteria bacterium]
MKLYYTRGSCSLTCRIVINEIGLPCEYESVDLKSKQTEHGGDFTKINLKGAVPTLVLDNGDILTENAVIQQYLADEAHATELLPKTGNIKRYHVLEWLNYIATDFHKGIGVLFNYALPQEIKDEVFKPIISHKLKSMDSHLENKKFIYDEHFTLPDAYFFVMLTWVLNFKFPMTDWPNLKRYFDELKQRPSIAKSLKEERLTF